MAKSQDAVELELNELRVEIDRLKTQLSFMQSVMQASSSQHGEAFDGQKNTQVSSIAPVIVPDSETPATAYQSHQRCPTAGVNKGDSQAYQFDEPNKDEPNDIYYLAATDLPLVRKPVTGSPPLLATTRYPQQCTLKVIAFEPAAGETLQTVLVKGVRNGYNGLHARLTTLILPDRTAVIKASDRTAWTTIFFVRNCSGNKFATGADEPD